MKIKLLTAFVIAALCCGNLWAQQETEADTESQATTALSFTMQNLAGEEIELSKYEGKVVLFVNVASECGFTRQYKPLQQLHDEYKEAGLAIVGVPCNQFGGQEPGSSAEIAGFCQKNYGVEFDMLAKVDVNGENQCELYKYLTGMDLAPAGTGKIKWNFEKILVDRSGNPIARFGSRTEPNDDEFIAAIKAALEESPESDSK